MSKAVLMSIQPKWCELIASGKKTVEIRKTKPKIEPSFKAYIYCTKDSKLQFWTGKRYSYADDHSHNLFDKCGNGKVIGEFLCHEVYEYESEFVDDDCRESIASIDRDEDGDITGFYEWTNEMDIPYIKTDFFKKCCVGYENLKKYIGLGFVTFYGLHISRVIIYDKPKELSEFRLYYTKAYYDEGLRLPMPTHEIKRPPQSWCYVKELENI